MARMHLTSAAWRWSLAVAGVTALAACGEVPTKVAEVGDVRLGILASRPGVDTSRAERLEVCKTWAGGVTPQDIRVRLQVSGGTTYDGQITIRPDESTDANGNPLQCLVIWENDRNSPVDYATVTEVAPSTGFTTTWAIDTKLSPTSGSTQPGPSYSGSGTVAQTVPIGGAVDNPGALVRFTNTAIETPGTEGCTPGYWKQSQHFDSWQGYATTDMLDAVFGVTFRSKHKQNPSGALTLLQALELNGNAGSEQLFRHGTAALLNAASTGVGSPYTAAQVISMVQTAWNSGNATAIANATAQLSAANELGCPLN